MSPSACCCASPEQKPQSSALGETGCLIANECGSGQAPADRCGKVQRPGCLSIYSSIYSSARALADSCHCTPVVWIARVSGNRVGLQQAAKKCSLVAS